MKKLFLFMTFSVVLAAQAQEVTEKSLEGNWKICAFDVNGIYWDFKTDAVRLPAEYANLGESQKEALIADIKTGLTDHKNGTFIIKGNYLEQNMAGQEASGSYTIEKKDGKDYLRIVNDDAAKTTDIVQVTLKDGKMQITVADAMGGTSTLIYCK
jgi:hypothetical protein